MMTANIRTAAEPYTPTIDEAFDATLYTWLDWKGTFGNEIDA